MIRQVRIRSMGSYLPKKIVSSEELDKKLKLSIGTLKNLVGVNKRHFVSEDETNSKMGAYACMAALENARLKFEDIDAIVYASGSSEQPIPCNAALIQKALGKENSGTPCFDVNATCLGFVIGLDVVSSLIQVERLKRVLLVTSEIASVALPWDHLESAGLFGDGAVAAVVEQTPAGEGSHIIATHQETYSSGSDICEVVGGGTGIHPRNYGIGKNVDEEDKRFLFKMDGPKVFRQSSKLLPSFVASAEKKTGIKLSDYDMVVPHQASAAALELIRRKLEIKPERFMNIVADYGNMIAASIPLALKIAIDTGRINRGDRVLLIGTSAGLSIGALAFQY